MPSAASSKSVFPDPIADHRAATRRLARNLRFGDVYAWLVEHGYFPESYVLPPCFRVRKRPARPRLFTRVSKPKGGGRTLTLTAHELCSVHFPKSELTDRSFGVMHPEHHNDICYHLARNWKQVVAHMIPADSRVTSYSFPVPLTSKHPGRIGNLRSGRMIYEFLSMAEEDIVSVAYRYSHIVRADIKAFYPSIYTHSIAWAVHGKRKIRSSNNRQDYGLLGNRLDKLFQYCNDQRTNGIPIGPAVSDIVAEIVAASVDRQLTKAVDRKGIACHMTRFKDDYRILVSSASDGRQVIKLLQAALKEFDLELAEEKTDVLALPEGLFRPWVSLYHVARPHPSKRPMTWRVFREFYLAVLRIDAECPGTGVIDRFLADIIDRKEQLKVGLSGRLLQKAMSMLLLMGRRRVKAFPKVVAIIESIFRSPLGLSHSDEIVNYLAEYLSELLKDEERNKYLISWLAYFFVSNGLKDRLKVQSKPRDLITRTVLNNRGALFRGARDFQLFEGCRTVGKRVSMLKHLDIFDPPRTALDEDPVTGGAS